MHKNQATWMIVTVAVVLGAGVERSFAAGGNCPAAPQNYDANGCRGWCAPDPIDPTVWVCDITAQPGNNDVVVVSNYRTPYIAGQERYSAWGTANGLNFCCTLDATVANPVNAVKVFTGNGSDEVWFTATNMTGVERNLTSNAYQTAPSWFVGYVYPGAENDLVHGSNSIEDDYMDHLTGENGVDEIHGNKGADFISVAETRTGAGSTGNSGEAVYGDNGRDEIVGATNNIVATDTIFVSGGAQNDLLCTGSVGSLTAQRVFFWGDAGDDQIYSNSSSVAGFDGPIDGGSGTDGCDNPGGGAETACNGAFNSAAFGPWTAMVCN